MDFLRVTPVRRDRRSLALECRDLRPQPVAKPMEGGWRDPCSGHATNHGRSHGGWNQESLDAAGYSSTNASHLGRSLIACSIPQRAWSCFSS